MNKRILSIDILRGLTIFFMIVVNTPGSWQYVYSPLLHAKWHGCTPTDLVFPSFLFVIGMSIAISFKNLGFEKPRFLYNKILKRGFIILIIGILLNWFPFTTPITELRIPGVLQRIALAYLGASLLIVFLKTEKRILTSAIFLFALHWLILILCCHNNNYFDLQDNFARHLDILMLGENHLYKGFGIPFDPEGILGTLSSIAQIIIGYLIMKKVLNLKKMTYGVLKTLAFSGIVFITLGLLLNIIYPINKPLWTGSYVFYTSGFILLIWSFLILIIDLKGYTKWTFIFKVFGRNPLISYVFSYLIVKIFLIINIGEYNLYDWLYSNVFQNWFGNYLGSFLFAITFTMFIWSISFLLYKKDKIIKL